VTVFHRPLKWARTHRLVKDPTLITFPIQIDFVKKSDNTVVDASGRCKLVAPVAPGPDERELMKQIACCTCEEASYKQDGCRCFWGRVQQETCRRALALWEKARAHSGTPVAVLAKAKGIPNALKVLEFYRGFTFRTAQGAVHPIEAEVVYSGDGRSDEKRRGLLERYKKGDVHVLVVVNMLGEGFDNPLISICALHTPVGGIGVLYQFLGRALRLLRFEYLQERQLVNKRRDDYQNVREVRNQTDLAGEQTCYLVAPAYFGASAMCSKIDLSLEPETWNLAESVARGALADEEGGGEEGGGEEGNGGGDEAGGQEAGDDEGDQEGGGEEGGGEEADPLPTYSLTDLSVEDAAAGGSAKMDGSPVADPTASANGGIERTRETEAQAHTDTGAEWQVFNDACRKKKRKRDPSAGAVCSDSILNQINSRLDKSEQASARHLSLLEGVAAAIGVNPSRTGPDEQAGPP
jgi:hypothetical protein